VALLLGLACACAQTPLPDAGMGTVWGYVTLVPTDGASGSGGGYGDRRLANVKRVDYSQLKYAVVYAPTAPRADAPLELRIEGDGDGGACLEPAFGATSPKTGLRITNTSASERIVSVPEHAWMRKLAAGETVSLDSLDEGEVSIYLLGQPESSSARLWVAPGARVDAGASGRYTLRGLSPGRHEIRAWHPRMPPGRPFMIDIREGEVQRVDLEITIDRSGR
jgi:hypothetical protein